MYNPWGDKMPPNCPSNVLLVSSKIPKILLVLVIIIIFDYYGLLAIKTFSSFQTQPFYD